MSAAAELTLPETDEGVDELALRASCAACLADPDLQDIRADMAELAQ